MAYVDQHTDGKQRATALLLSITLMGSFAYVFGIGLAQRFVPTKTPIFTYVPPKEVPTPPQPSALPPTQTERILLEVPQPSVPHWDEPIVEPKALPQPNNCTPYCLGSSEPGESNLDRPPVPPVAPPEKIRTGVDVQQLLRLYRKGDIPYPSQAERLNQEGTTRCTVHVLATGVVDVAQCMGAGDILDSAAARYLLHYRFPPAAVAHEDATPVAAWATLPPIKWMLPHD